MNIHLNIDLLRCFLFLARRCARRSPIYITMNRLTYIMRRQTTYVTHIARTYQVLNAHMWAMVEFKSTSAERTQDALTLSPIQPKNRRRQ